MIQISYMECSSYENVAVISSVYRVCMSPSDDVTEHDYWCNSFCTF